MEKEKYFYIKCFFKVENEYKENGYFMEIYIIEGYRDVATVNTTQYAKRYKKRGYAERMIEKIHEEIKNTYYLFEEDRTCKFKFEIVEE